MNFFIKLALKKFFRKFLFSVGAALVALPFFVKGIQDGYIDLDQLKQWADLTVNLLVGLVLMAITYAGPLITEWLKNKKITTTK